MKLRILLLVPILFILISGAFNFDYPGENNAEALSFGENQSSGSVSVYTAQNQSGEYPYQPFDKYFREYMTVGNITTHLKRFESTYPDLVKLIDIASYTDHGATWQGRNLWAIKISDNAKIDDPDEPDTLILGNIHAREWMAFEAPMYFIFHLLENYGLPPTDNDGDGKINEDMFDGLDNDGDGLVDEDWSEAKVTWLVNNREIWVVPTLNPDGTIIDFEMQASGGGSWRKNARDNNGNGGFEPEYDGVDLNRNFAYHWDENQQGIISENGIEYRLDSTNPTSGVYRGPYDNFDNDGDSLLPAPDLWDPRYRRDWNGIDEDPWDGIDNDADGKIDEDKDGGLSEPETQAVEWLMRQLDSDGNHHNMRSDVGISIAYHSVGGWVIWPWGFTKNPTPHEELIRYIGFEFMDQTGYTSWEADEMYMVSGASDDHLYGVHGVLAYTIELNDEPGAGFHPPKELIINTSRKVLSCNLYAAEMTGVALIARDGNYPDLNIGLPSISHKQTVSVISDIEPYKVVAEVDNFNNIDTGSMTIHYRIGQSGKYRTAKMSDNGEVNSGLGTGSTIKKQFAGYIPAQPDKDGAEVYYYITGKDVRGILVSGPVYGEGEPYHYKIDANMGFTFMEAAVAIIMAIIFIVIVWGGFFRGVHKAVRADKRKAAIDDY